MARRRWQPGLRVRGVYKEGGHLRIMAKPLNFKQELTAAFGSPISENPTQVMIEAAYRHHGLDWRYLTESQTSREYG